MGLSTIFQSDEDWQDTYNEVAERLDNGRILLLMQRNREPRYIMHCSMG